jgi:spermidine synthase
LNKQIPLLRSPMLRVALLVLFAGSGCSALIYEVVWYQLLQLTIGSTAISLGILLATFMGGLCIGSLALPRLLPIHPLRAYAGIEAGIACFGLLELVLIPAIDHFYIVAAQGGMAGMLARGLVCAVALLPPTILMGASLPAISRFVTAAPGASQGAAWWGLLYAANTLGAVTGCLAAGFYLLRLTNMTTTSFVAAGINLVVAAASFALAMAVKSDAPVTAEVTPQARRDSRWEDWAPHIVIAISGACALGAEIIWTRLLGLMFGATVYAFSIILAVFLVGLVIGTASGSAWLRRTDARLAPRWALGWAQILNVLAMAWTATMIADAIPYWPIDPTLSPSPRFIFEIDFVRALTAMLPPTILWGASFPLAFAAVKSGGPGRVVGGVYAANTFGAIFGALGVSLVLIPWIGTQNSQRVLMALSAAGGLVLLAPAARQASVAAFAAGVAALAACLFLIMGVDRVPDELIAYGRRMPMNAGKSTILFTGEGRNTSIAVSRWHEDNSLQFHVAGKVEASTNTLDMVLQRMLGHLAAAQIPDPHSVLIVGFGAGVTAGSFTTYPSVKRIVICELEPLIPPTSTKYFAAQNYDVMHDPRTQIVYDDARHFVLTTPEKFDIITSDPIHPFVKGSAALYSKDYFESVKAHLNPDGVVTQWVPLYESDIAVVKSEIATFMAVFPGAMVFANTDNGGGYDLALVGQNHPHPIDLDTVRQKLDQPAYVKALTSLQNVGFDSTTELFATYAGNQADLKPWLADAQINHDDDLRLQYLAGLALNVSEDDKIYKAILSYRTKDNLPFRGSPPAMAAFGLRMQSNRFPIPPGND